MPIIDATISGINANSYLTLNRAAVLADEVPHGSKWYEDTTVAVDTRLRALIHATHLIDRHGVFLGSRTVLAQALKWPRTGIIRHEVGTEVSSVAIPDFIEDATIEMAMALLDGDRQGDLAHGGLSALRLGALSMQFQAGPRPAIPPAVQRILRPYVFRFAGLGSIKLTRT